MQSREAIYDMWGVVSIYDVWGRAIGSWQSGGGPFEAALNHRSSVMALYMCQVKISRLHFDWRGDFGTENWNWNWNN